MEKINIGEDFTQFMGEFKHDYFYSTALHENMDDYTEKYLYFRSFKTDIIYEFKLGMFPGLMWPALLITSTNNDTCFVMIYKRGKPSIERTIHRLNSFWKNLKTGAKQSRYVKMLNALEDDFSPEGLSAIQKELERRRQNEKQ